MGTSGGELYPGFRSRDDGSEGSVKVMVSQLLRLRGDKEPLLQGEKAEPQRFTLRVRRAVTFSSLCSISKFLLAVLLDAGVLVPMETDSL